MFIYIRQLLLLYSTNFDKRKSNLRYTKMTRFNFRTENNILTKTKIMMQIIGEKK